MTVDGVEVMVAAGECAVFQADRPHRYAAARGRATRFVMVVIEPIEPPGPSPRRRRPSARPGLSAAGTVEADARHSSACTWRTPSVSAAGPGCRM